MRLRSVSLFLLVLFTGLLPRSASAQAGGDFGTVTVTVRPASAEIFIDGERWVSPDTTGPLVVQLAPGRHRIDVRAPGHRPFSTVVDVRQGESTPLNVILPAGPQEPRGFEQPPAPPAPPVGRPGRISRLARRSSDDGFVWAPDFKVTDLNHRTTGFGGFYGGFVFGGQLMVGGGAYFQLDDYTRHDSEQMVYGGFVTEWRLLHDKPVGLTLHGLVGGGTANRGYVYAVDGRDGRYADPRHGGYDGYYYGYPYRYEGFVVGEPEAQVVARFGHSVRLVGGGGYRWTSATASNLDGWTASVGVQFGK